MYKIILYLLLLNTILFSSSKFRDDDSKLRLVETKDPNSHINIFLPSIPYSYIAKNINSGLIRSYDNNRGWEYDIAKSHQRLDDFTYVFEIRKNLKFQDGSEFTIDNVIRNLEHFKKYPLLYTNIDKVDYKIEKLDKHRIKITLNQKYEMFLHDLARVYFYTDEYLKKYNPKGSEVGSSNEVPGAYGMGPYILESGFSLGKKQTSKLELVANPYYWDARYPKIQRITIYTELDSNEAIELVTNHEGHIDFMPIPFNKKIDVLMSKYSKLIVKESTNNFIIFFNLINGNEKLLNKDVRIALNKALNQENLLNFVYKKEGKISPFSASRNFDVVEKIVQNKDYKKITMSEKRKHELLNGLELNIFTQDRFMFLFKGIEFQLKKYGVKFNYTITNSESDIYKQLLNTNTNKNTIGWDLLIWGNDDWYYKNPWTVFFIYEHDSSWSTIRKDELINEYIKEYFQTKIGTKEYEKVTSKILNRARDMAYTLRVPSPNKVVALNKEVHYTPYIGGMIPLWKVQITKDHWSVRGDKPYPKNYYIPVKPKRYSK